MQRTTLLRALKWDLLALTALLIVVAFYHGVDRPYLRLAEESRLEGSRPPDRSEGDVLLLLPDAPAAAATQLSELDCSYGWFNALWQHYGSFASAMTRHLSPEDLGRAKRRDRAPARGLDVAEHGHQRLRAVRERRRPGDPRAARRRLGALERHRHPEERSQPRARSPPWRAWRFMARCASIWPNAPLIGQVLSTPTQPTWPEGPTLLEIDTQRGCSGATRVAAASTRCCLI